MARRPSGVVVRRIVVACIVRSGVDESVERGRALTRGIVVVPIDVPLVPRWARVFDALRDKMVGSDGIAGVISAVGRRWLVRIAARIRRSRTSQWRSSCCGVELRQPIERLVWVAILRPIFAQSAEIVIERTILLRNEYDVIDRRRQGRRHRRERPGIVRHQCASQRALYSGCYCRGVNRVVGERRGRRKSGHISGVGNVRSHSRSARWRQRERRAVKGRGVHGLAEGCRNGRRNGNTGGPIRRCHRSNRRRGSCRRRK